MDRNGNLFFVLLEPLALVCWDSSTPYSNDNIRILYQNDVTLQFSSGMKVKQNLNGDDELWIMTDRLQNFMVGDIKRNEVNYRIMKKEIRTLLKNKNKCNGQSLSESSNFIFPNRFA